MHEDFRRNEAERVDLANWLFQSGKLASMATPTLPGYRVRPMSQTESQLLSRRSNRSTSSWRRVFLASKSSSSSILDSDVPLDNFVSDCSFDGTVVLIISGEPALQEALYSRLPRGLHKCSSVSNCIIALDSVRIHQCTILANTFIDSNAVVFNCGSLACPSRLRDILSIAVGPEAGGVRPLVVQPEATMIQVGNQLRGDAPAIREEKGAKLDFNVVGKGCILRDTSSVDCVYMYANSRLEGASRVENCVLFESASVEGASTVKNCALQWKCSISGNSFVEDTLLMEHASVGPSSVVASSILGPDVHVSAGEVHASVLGPNCNAHHQSLLISVIWPLGRGNVGYGANVGSNHTGRIPDQECWAGEGLFWGLSSVVKFPVNMTRAPYSVVAAGCVLAPQKCSMPFSLIVSNKTGGSAIVPGWVLRSSPYTIVRSEAKFSKRRKALRHLDYTGWKIIRPEIIQLCVQARAKLSQVSVKKDLYSSDKDISGIGANELSEKGRLSGIQTYSDCIQLFALRGLLERFQSHGIHQIQQELTMQKDPALPKDEGFSDLHFPWDVDQSSDTSWSYQKSLIQLEFGPSASLSDLLKKLLSLEQDNADRVYKSKMRDDIRGVETIPQYRDAHILADQDEVVSITRVELARVKNSVGQLLTQLDEPLVTNRSKL